MNGAPGPRRARAFLLLQRLLPRTLLTRVAGTLSRLRRPAPLRRLAIRLFVRHYGVDMSEAANPDPDAYESFEHEELTEAQLSRIEQAWTREEE